MKTKSRLAIAFTFIMMNFSICGIASAQQIMKGESANWYKADLHTHHTYSDPLETTATAYEKTGYQFVVLSTKDMQTPLNVRKQSTPGMLVVEGVEQAFITRKNMLGHVIAFPIKAPYPVTTAWSLKEGYEKLRAKNKNVILGVNHPHDKRWTLEDIIEASDEGVRLFELNSIDMKHGEFETALWDQALAEGARMYATLTNDVHHMNDVDAYGYIMVRAKELSLPSIAEAIVAGDFYAKESECKVTPVEYNIAGSAKKRTLEIIAPGAAEITVIADGSKVANFKENRASYKLKGSEKYVRAEISDSNGRYIFMQPFFFSK
ncbi:MAG TPA: CehA/McbA family metallohydrolase [bacterium]|nr:CehA/McbA family metallohydrolase [bacterium]